MFTRSWISFILTAVLSAVAFSPCSHAEDVLRTPQSVPADMARLLHKDTTAFVYIGSPAQFAESLKELSGTVDPKNGNAMMSQLSPKSLLGSLVLTKNEIRIDQPIGIGYWGTEEDNDMPYVVIFRVQDATPKTVMAKGKGRRLMFLEGTDWIAVTNAGASWTPAAENAPMPSVVQNMLPGQCAMSFDQVAWLGTSSHKSINESLKTHIKKMKDEAMQAAMIELLDDWIYGFTRWDFAVKVDDGDLDLDARYEPTADSRFAITGTPDLAQLGHRLPGQLAFQSVFSTDCISSSLELMKPFVIAQAGKDKQRAASLLSDVSALIASQGDGCGTAIGMSEYGIDLAQIFQVKDASATFGLIDAYLDDVNAAKAGLHYKRMPVLVGGDSSRLYEVTFDKKDMKEANPALKGLVDSDFMYMLDAAGEDKIYLRVISKGTWMAVVAGEPKLLGRMRRALSQPSAFNPSLDHIAVQARGDLVMAMSLDLRSLFNGVLAYLHAHPKELKQEMDSKQSRHIMSELRPIMGPPAVMSASMASEDDGAVTFSFVCDVRQIAALGWEIWDKFQQAANDASAAKKAEEAKKPGKK